VGTILANGGRGATGENTAYHDHIGGTGGGGSGGHVILESATLVEFTGTVLRDFVAACGPPLKTGPLGGANVEACCTTYSNGGAGGAGLIQIHVPDPITEPGTDPATSDIVVPQAAADTATPLDQITSPPAIAMIPTFGARSKVQSKWISLGGADQKPPSSCDPPTDPPTESDELVRFLFDGIELARFPGDPNEGKIKTNGSKVEDRAPLVTSDGDLRDSDPDPVQECFCSSTARIDGYTLEIEGAALDEIRTGTTGTTSPISNDVYLRTPTLLEDCVVRMRVVPTPANFEDFPIARASYDEGSADPGDELLRLTVGTERGRLSDYITANSSAGPIGFQLLPRFFSVVTNGQRDSLPTDAFVRLRFQAAQDNGSGAPLIPPRVDWTADVSRFNALDPGEKIQFFRFEVEFDLDALAQGVSADTVPVTLEFLRVPFVF
jgi:hypothetical protein